MQFNLPTLFPDTYLPDVHARLVFYKRIAGASSAEELHALQLEAIDRFGPPPEAAKSLFRISKLQLDSQAMGIRRFTLDQNGGRIEFDPNPTIDPGPLLQLMADEPGVFRMADAIRSRFESHLRSTQRDSNLPRNCSRNWPSNERAVHLGNANLLPSRTADVMVAYCPRSFKMDH